MCSRSKYHNLINGPRTIQQNLVIFNELCRFISIQIALIAAQLKFYLNIKFQDTLTKLLFELSHVHGKGYLGGKFLDWILCKWQTG